jgi:hypothetical protein
MPIRYKRSRRTRAASAALALAVVLVAVPSSSAAGRRSLNGRQVIAKVNAFRVANGMAPVVEVPAWSTGCKAHDRYGLRNGLDVSDPHNEHPGLPLFSRVGQTAAKNSILAPLGWRDPQPWLNGPIHLMQMLEPRLERSGGWALSRRGGRGFSCVDTNRGFNPLPWPTELFRSYPSNGRTAPYAQRVREIPATPAWLVGLRNRGGPFSSPVTGPNLLVWYYGPLVPGDCWISGYPGSSDFSYQDPVTGARVPGDPDGPQPPFGACHREVVYELTGVRLEGPGGAAVPVRFLRAVPHSWRGDRGIIVPVHPLKRQTNYTVSVTFSPRNTAQIVSAHRAEAAPPPVTKTFSFRTTNRALG